LLDSGVAYPVLHRPRGRVPIATRSLVFGLVAVTAIIAAAGAIESVAPRVPRVAASTSSAVFALPTIPSLQVRQSGQSRGRASDQAHSFYFTRGMYTGFRRSWATDAPQADRWITSVLHRLTLIDTSLDENFVALDDPDLGRFPFLYLLEVGGMRLTDAERDGLRDYILRGGFVMVDDFWGSAEWANWEQEIRRVLPEYQIVEVPLSHPIFNTMYLIDEVVQVPSVSGAQAGITSQRDGIVPHVRGIFDEKDRLMVVINWNTDVGDAWEWAEASYYPLVYSTYAYQVAANTFMYALTR
jgi:hypothetical protein